MAAYDYICMIFNMPVEIWNLIGQQDAAEEESQ